MKRNDENNTNLEVINALLDLRAAMDALVRDYFTDHSVIVRERWEAKMQALTTFNDIVSAVDDEIGRLESRFNRAIGEYDAVTKDTTGGQSK